MAAVSALQERPVNQRREPRVRLDDRSRERQQDVVPDLHERTPRVLGRVPPGVVDVERRAVVDEVEPPVPDEEVGVPGRPVHVRHERVEPDDVRGQVRVRRGPDRPGGRRGHPAGSRGRCCARRCAPAGPGSRGRARPSPSAGSSSTRTSSGTGQSQVPRRARPRRAPRPAPCGPWPAPRNLTTYSPSSSASTRAGSEPPSRSGVT